MKIAILTHKRTKEKSRYRLSGGYLQAPSIDHNWSDICPSCDKSLQELVNQCLRRGLVNLALYTYREIEE